MAAAAQAGARRGQCMVGVVSCCCSPACSKASAGRPSPATSTRYAIGGGMLALWLAYFYLLRAAAMARASATPPTMARSLVTPEGVDLGVSWRRRQPRRGLPARRRDHHRGGDRRDDRRLLRRSAGWASSGCRSRWSSPGWSVLLPAQRLFHRLRGRPRAATPGKRHRRHPRRRARRLGPDDRPGHRAQRDARDRGVPAAVDAASGSGLGVADSLRRCSGWRGRCCSPSSRCSTATACASATWWPAPGWSRRRGARCAETCPTARCAGAAFAFTTAQLDAYGIAELHMLEEVLRGDNEAALRTVAEAIRARSAGRRGGRAAPFLTAYYDDLGPTGAQAAVRQPPRGQVRGKSPTRPGRRRSVNCANAATAA